MDTKAFGGSMDHGNTLRKFSSESEPLFISDILLLLRVRVMVGLGRVMFGDRTHEGSRLCVSPYHAPPSRLHSICSPWAMAWPQLSSPEHAQLLVTGASWQTRIAPFCNDMLCCLLWSCSPTCHSCCVKVFFLVILSVL